MRFEKSSGDNKKSEGFLPMQPVSSILTTSFAAKKTGFVWTFFIMSLLQGIIRILRILMNVSIKTKYIFLNCTLYQRQNDSAQFFKVIF